MIPQTVNSVGEIRMQEAEVDPLKDAKMDPLKDADLDQSVQVVLPGHSMSVKDVDSMEDRETSSKDKSFSNGGSQEKKKEEKEKPGLNPPGVGLPPSHTDIPRLSSDHLPLCLAAKDLPHSLPVYCGACTQNGMVISQDVLQPGVITSCSVPLTMPPMTLTDPAIIPSVIGPPSMPVASLSDLPTIQTMKLQLSSPEKEPVSPPGVERACRWLQCNRRFTSLDDLVNHVNDHHVKVERPDIDYQCKWTGCPRLGKGFNARYKMLIHIRTHTNEKPHRCGLCGKCFSRLENLKIHNRSHTGEKPYVCPFEGCNKAYSNSSDRFKHVRTHQEEKPYICKMPGCNKRYTDPSSLRKHVRTIGHYFRGDGIMTPKLKQSSSPSPVPTPPISANSIITLAPSNGILGNLPPAHFMPLASNIFPVSALQSPFSPPVVPNSPAHSTGFTLPINRSGVFVSEARTGPGLPTDNSMEKKESEDSTRCQDGPLDLSRSPLPHQAKEDDAPDSVEHLQVD